MAILAYPGLDQVPDEGTKSALRLIWEQLRTLDEREEVTEGLTDTELTQVQSALQTGGDAPLDVGGLTGLLQGGQKSPTRQYGGWTNVTTVASAGIYTWTHEILNTASHVFRLAAAGSSVWIREGGTYLSIARLTTKGHASGVQFQFFIDEPGSVATDVHSLAVNTDDTDTAKFYTGELIDVIRVKAGTYLRYGTRYGHRVGDAFKATTVYLIRLI